MNSKEKSNVINYNNTMKGEAQEQILHHYLLHSPMVKRLSQYYNVSKKLSIYKAKVTLRSVVDRILQTFFLASQLHFKVHLDLPPG